MARRYASALMEIGRREGRIEEILAELLKIRAMFEEYPNLWKVVSLPIWPLEGRRKVLSSVMEKMEFSEAIIRFCDILVEKERIKLLSAIISVFQNLVDKVQNRVRGVLYAPEKLKDEDFERLKGALAKFMGKEVVLERDVDPALIGGIKARIGETIIDGSVRGQLDRYREKLLSG